MTPNEKIDAATDLIVRYGGIDGAHHKQWVLDQVLRVFRGDDYPAFIAEICKDEHGRTIYGWDVGIAP